MNTDLTNRVFLYLTIKPSTMSKPIKKDRDAGTGQYVTKEYAEKHPKTTVTETQKPAPKPAKKK